MILTGDVRTFADALGKRLGSSEVTAAMAIAGLPSTTSEFLLGSAQRTYYSTDDKSVDFLFEDDSLRSVIVSTQPTERRGSYARGDTLFEQFPATAPRATVRDVLGPTEWTSEEPDEEADQFAVDGFFQHIVFVDGRIAHVTLMRDDPAEW